MVDREKVVKGIQCRLELKCNECPYTSDDDVCDDCDSLFRDVLELLKEKEEEIENLKQTCQSMMEGAYLLKEREAVESKTGHWIWLQCCANEGVYCSECHTKMFDYYPMKKKLSQFCGHCGAKMGDEVGVR